MPATARLKISCPSNCQRVDAVEHAVVGVAPAHALHAQDLARLAEAAELLGQHAFLARRVASSTTAAAPSPNSTATSRSLQSMNGEMSSAPITSAFRTTPVRISAVAVDSP